MKGMTMDQNFKTYRDVIRYEFFFRHHKNPAYSMSAFARDLGIAPSRLSEIFSGKQGLSPKRAREVGSKIGYRAKKLTWFCNLVASETARSPKMKAAARAKLEEVRNGVMSEAIQTRLPVDLRWEHIAVRRMALMDEFRESAEWISEKLGVSTEVIRRVLSDLIEHHARVATGWPRTEDSGVDRQGDGARTRRRGKRAVRSCRPAETDTARARAFRPCQRRARTRS